MKRILSLILTVSVVISMFIIPQSVYSADYESFEKELAILTDIGIVDSEFQKKNAEDKVTRGEYAKLICALINLSSGSSEFEVKFLDVPADETHFASIMTLEGLGYINGYSETEFLPNREITLTEAMKIVVRIMGYTYLANSQGGYPTGYQYTATNLGLTKGIKNNYNLSACFADIVKMLYNSLDIDIAKVTGVSDNGDKNYTIVEDENILTEYHKMQKTKGIVTANQLTGIMNYAPVPEDTISVDGVIYGVKDSGNMTLLGYEVELIYSIAEDGDDKIVSIVKAEKPEYTFELDIEDIYDQKDNTIIYEDDNGNIESITFDKSADIIYNGEKKSVDNKFFTTLSQGTVKFLKTSGGSYNVVIINDFKTMVVDTINENNKILTDRYTKVENNVTVKYTLDLSDDNKLVTIMDSNDKPVNFHYISSGDILTYAENENNVVVYVGGETVNGEISEVFVEDGVTCVKINDTAYKFNKEANERYSSVSASDPVKLSLDKFGNIAYVDILNKDGFERMFLVKLGEKELGADTSVFGKLYSTAGGLNSYDFAVNLNIDGSLVKDITKDKISAAMNENTEQMIEVKLDENNIITHIRIAREMSEIENTNIDGFVRTHKLGKRAYYEDPPSFERALYFNSSTRFIMIPKDLSNVKAEDISIGNKASLSNGDSYNLEAYNSSKNYTIPEDIIIRTESGTSSAPSIINETPVAVIKGSSVVQTEDGDIVTRVKYQSGYTEGYYYIDEGNIPSDSFKPTGSETAETVYANQVEEGDIVQLSKDNNGYIRAIKVYSDYSEGEYLDIFFNSNYKAGIFRSNIAKKNGNYLFVPHWYETAGNDMYGIFDLSEKTLSLDGIIVVEDRGTNPPLVRNGSSSDIEKGDNVVIHIAYAQFLGIIIFK